MSERDAHLMRLGSAVAALRATDVDDLICGNGVSCECEEPLRQIFDLLRDYERYGTTDPATVERLEDERREKMIAPLRTHGRWRLS